jgi:methyl-accepting chemotaxis protein
MVRALDDLHSLARSAETLSRAVGPLDAERVERLPQIEAALADIESEALRRADSLDQHLAGVLELAERIERGLPAIGEVLGRISALDGSLAHALEVVGRLESDISSLGRIAPSVDVLTGAAGRLADTVEPLQGAAERLGRIADRLPGARSRA